MLEAIGFEKFVPDVGSLEDAVSAYHSCLAEQQKIPATVVRILKTCLKLFCSSNHRKMNAGFPGYAEQVSLDMPNMKLPVGC